MENIYAIRLKNLIEELDIKQNELAQKAGITEATISNYINAKQLPKLGVVEKLADVLGVSVDYLLGKSDVKNPGKQIDDVLNEAMIGMSKEEYEALSETQKKQIRDFALFVKNQCEDNKKIKGENNEK